MVAALCTARLGSGSSSPSSKRIMKSTHSLGFLVRAAMTRRAFFAGQSIVGENLLHLAGFLVGNLFDLAFFAQALACVMLGVAAGGEISAETHGDGAGGDFGHAGDDHEAAVVHGAGNSGSQREGNGQAVGHSDDNVADDFARGEVALNVRRLRHVLPARDGFLHTRRRALPPRARLCSLVCAGACSSGSQKAFWTSIRMAGRDVAQASRAVQQQVEADDLGDLGAVAPVADVDVPDSASLSTISARTPVSSRTSRRAVSSGFSPGSMEPLGKAMSSASAGVRLERGRRMFCGDAPCGAR